MSRGTVAMLVAGIVFGLTLGCGTSRTPGGTGAGITAMENWDAPPDLASGVKFKGRFQSTSGKTYIVHEVRGHWIKVSELESPETRWLNINGFTSYQIVE